MRKKYSILWDLGYKAGPQLSAWLEMKNDSNLWKSEIFFCQTLAFHWLKTYINDINITRVNTLLPHCDIDKHFFRMFFCQNAKKRIFLRSNWGYRRLSLSFVTAPDLQKLQMTFRAHVTMREKQVIC